MNKRALITGITGQDGSYLCELLLAKGYDVHGIIRRSSTFGTQRIEHLYTDAHDPNARLRLHYGDLLDASGLRHVISACQPDEVYNLGAQSHVRTSFDQPTYTAETIAIGTLNLLEAVRDYRDSMGREVRLYQASSSEMFGNAREVPQSESTRFYPRSPYACAKVHAFYQTVNHREAYKLFACNGILFNHESPRRGETFVTRKITRAATRIKKGLQKRLYLGNLDARRDWGFAGDYVEAMWSMLQQPEPDDYVIAGGESHSVREFLDGTFEYLDLDWRDHVEIDGRYFRPTEVNVLCGDASKARHLLGWQPRVSFRELVRMMVDSDMAMAERERTLTEAGLSAGWNGESSNAEMAIDNSRSVSIDA
ncbi:MAG: GDP-mannose 4,6-dehydratase [Phycisphaerales bacterium]|nr:GDP-mannose 4,6-dehydratase [Phycisphaerales bacterium]